MVNDGRKEGRADGIPRLIVSIRRRNMTGRIIVMTPSLVSKEFTRWKGRKYRVVLLNGMDIGIEKGIMGRFPRRERGTIRIDSRCEMKRRGQKEGEESENDHMPSSERGV